MVSGGAWQNGGKVLFGEMAIKMEKLLNLPPSVQRQDKIEMGAKI